MVLPDTGTLGTSREIFSEDADGETADNEALSAWIQWLYWFYLFVYWLVRFLITAYICQQLPQIMSHFTNLLDMSFSLLLSFYLVLSPETSVCSVLKFCPVFLGS